MCIQRLQNQYSDIGFHMHVLQESVLHDARVRGIILCGIANSNSTCACFVADVSRLAEVHGCGKAARTAARKSHLQNAGRTVAPKLKGTKRNAVKRQLKKKLNDVGHSLPKDAQKRKEDGKGRRRKKKR